MGEVALLPVVGMVMAECAQAGLMIVSKVAMSDGMNNLIFVFYSNLLASPLLLFFSFLFYRSDRPQLTSSIHAGFFLLGLLGMEKLDWRSTSSLAKSVGTIVSISGAFIVTFYEGPSLLMTSQSVNLSHAQLPVQQPNWIVGGLFLLADCIMTSAWVIVEAKILRKYPVVLIVVFFYCLYVAVLSGSISFIVERDPSAWSLKPNVRLLAVLYSAVFGSAFQVGVCTWCLKRTGPVFVAMFKPLGIVITVIVGVIFMGEAIYFGRLIGAIIIVAGFYSVMWGKAKEAKVDEDAGISILESNRQQAPLLQNGIEN
ncbi:WAT1-related protein At3g28050 isoform X2 [Ziziphus jujuba]|uniref:WAT1-related protein n=1 Tax=Ziziphus jujuba TaxID=326968 RepID=A0ABM3I0D4_ZIZJJ|nr:WAT1-related protein At3g28050 isoform X2 [Ziziphus jujuba]